MQRNLRRLNERQVGQLFTELEDDNAFVDEMTTEAALRVLEDDADVSDMSSIITATAGPIGGSRGGRKAGGQSFGGNARKGGLKRSQGRILLSKALKNQHKVYCDAWMTMVKNEVSVVMTQCAEAYDHYLNTNIASRGDTNTDARNAPLIEQDVEVIRPALMSFIDTFAYPSYIFPTHYGDSENCSGSTDAKTTKKTSASLQTSSSAGESFLGLCSVAGVPLGPSYESMTSPPPCELSTTPYTRWQWSSPDMWESDAIRIGQKSVAGNKNASNSNEDKQSKKRSYSRAPKDDGVYYSDDGGSSTVHVLEKSNDGSSDIPQVREIPVVFLQHGSNTHKYGDQSRRLCSICYKLAKYTCSKCGHQSGGGARFCSVACGDVHEEMRCNKYVVL
eukprot:Tbor_TRINITY_DN5564_c0_g1::TRINITY_DN5564_c0_g1_i1::g.12970::m.12970